MTQLTEQHREFLRQNEIPEDAVLFAHGLKRSDYQEALKEQNKAVAFVDNPCGKNHTLRLRLSSGHCMQCSPLGIARKRHQIPGYVYIAASISLRRIKIGFSKAPSDRADTLLRDGYGGAKDWTILYRRKFNRGGDIESKAKSLLRDYHSPLTYTRLGHGTTGKADELFACNYAVARDVVESFEEHALTEKWERPIGNLKYDFVGSI